MFSCFVDLFNLKTTEKIYFEFPYQVFQELFFPIISFEKNFILWISPSNIKKFQHV